MSGVSNSAQMPTPPRRGSKSRCCISATVREAPSDIAKSPLAARVAPIPAERALAGFRRALGPPSRFESPGTTAVALAPPRPADGRESNSAGSRRLGTEAPSGARTRRLGALLLPPRRFGAGDALARPRTAGRRLAADARRGLARAAGRADPRGELLRRHRRPRARLLARARARGATGRPRSLPALLRGPPGCARSHLCRRRRCRLRTACRCLDRPARPRRGGRGRPAPSPPPDARERGRRTRLPGAAHTGPAARDRARDVAHDRGRSAAGLALRPGLGPAAASLGAALRPPGRAARSRGGRGPAARPRTGGAAAGAERGRRARPALRRRGVRARPRRGDGLRPTGDRLPGAWPGGDRRRRKDGLAHSARRRGGARRLAPRGRSRSGGTPGSWATRSGRQPPIRLGGDRSSLRVPVRGATRLLSRAAGCARAARLTAHAQAVQLDESLTDLAALAEDLEATGGLS